MDPDTQSMPIEGAPAMPPESAMPEDPNAPPPSPAEEAAATTDPNVPRQ
jgi:hypothetical protein